MPIIGLNDTTGLGSAAETTAASHALMNGTGFTYVAGANEDVFRFGYYSGTAGSNATVQIGLYDITGGATNAPLVTSGQVTGTAGSTPFTVDVTPVTLTNGNTYCVAWRIVANGNMQRAFTSNACRTSTLTGADALAATFTNNAGLSQKYAVWAETQASSGVSITSVTGSAADVVRAGESVTIVGTGFNAAQGDGSVTIAGVAGAVTLTVGSWSATSITCTAPAEQVMFGGSKTITVTNSDESSDTHSVTYNPPTGWIYETLTDDTPPADSMAAGASGLAVGDQVYLNATADGPGAATATVAFLGAGDGTVQLTGVTVDGDYLVSVEIRDATDGTDTTNGPQTITVDTTAPVGYAINIDQAAVSADNETATSFTFSAAEVGAAWSLTVTSSGGGTPVTDSGTIATATDQITGIDVSGLSDGTLVYSVTLTDTVGNIGDASTDTVAKSISPPGEVGGPTRTLTRPLCRALSRSLTG